MTLANNAANRTVYGKTSDPLAGYRKGLNSATWGLSQSTLYNGDPESIGKLNPSLWSQARGLLPSMIVIPQINTDMMIGAYYSSPNGAPLQRAQVQVSFLQSQL